AVVPGNCRACFLCTEGYPDPAAGGRRRDDDQRGAGLDALEQPGAWRHCPSELNCRYVRNGYTPMAGKPAAARCPHESAAPCGYASPCGRRSDDGVAVVV